jgi:molybdate transport system substrate-binding protein
MKLHASVVIVLAAAAAAVLAPRPASAAEIKVLTAGAYKQVVLALVPAFEQQTGHKVSVDNGTAGELQKRIDGGEAFDVAVISPVVVEALTDKGRIVRGSRHDLATVGVGVVVKEGTPKPDISTVEAFKQTMLAAKSIAYIDPKSGGTTGIYIEKLMDRLGIGEAVRAKAKLKMGGYVADLVVSGEAEIGLHQISEIVPVKGAVLVGPLPKEIQNITTYSAGLSTTTKNQDAAQALIKAFSSPDAAKLLKSKGMEPAT